MSENGFDPTIVAFVCNWCTYTAADLAGTARMCQMNLEAYQREASRAGGHRQEVPVLYLPQIMRSISSLSSTLGE